VFGSTKLEVLWSHKMLFCVWSGSDTSPYEYCSGSWKPEMTTLSVRRAPVRGIKFQYIVRLNLRPCKCLPCKTKATNQGWFPKCHHWSTTQFASKYWVYLRILSNFQAACTMWKRAKQLTWKEYVKGPSRCVLKTSCVRTRCWIFVSSFFSIIVSHKVTCQRIKP